MWYEEWLPTETFTLEGIFHMTPPLPAKTISLQEYFKTGYILIVDDNANMRQTIRGMLREFRVTNVAEADDGDTALKILKRKRDLPCFFVLLDWIMPRLSGIDVVREIRADNEIGDLPIMMVTAETDPAQIVRAAEEGINGYLTKPFAGKVLEQKIQGILEARANPPLHVKLLMEAEQFLRKGDYDNAFQFFEKSLATKETARVMVHLGDIHQARNNTDEAFSMYDGAINNNSRFLKAYSKASELHEKEGHVDTALDLLTRALAISPNSPERLVSVGKLHVKKGNEALAADAFTKAVKLESKMGIQIADDLLKNGNAHAAEMLLRKVSGNIGQDSFWYNRMGIALRKQGKWKEAVLEYQEALKLDSTDENIHFNLGKAYLEGKEYTAAYKCFNMALQLRPGRKEFLDELEELEKLRSNLSNY